MKDIKCYLRISDTQKFQTITITTIFSKDNDKECAVHSKNHNIEIMINDEVGKLEKTFLIHFYPDIKLGWKHELKVVILYLMLLNYCIAYTIK